MAQLTFKTHTFAAPPKGFTLTHQNNIRVFSASTMALKGQHLGVGGRVLRATGTLFGEDLQGQYEKIKTLFCEESKGTLTLEGVCSFTAFFSKFEVAGSSGPRALDYRVEFIEAAV